MWLQDVPNLKINYILYIFHSFLVPNPESALNEEAGKLLLGKFQV